MQAAHDVVKFCRQRAGDKQPLRDAAGEEELAPVLVAIARSFPEDHVLLRNVFEALTRLMVNHKGNKGQAGRAGAASAVVDVLRQRHSRLKSGVAGAELQCAAAEALGCLVLDHEENKHIAGQSGAVAVVLGLVADATADVKLRCCAAEALERLMQNHHDNKSIAGHAHAARDLSSILQDDGTDVQLRCKSADALTSLVTNHSENKLKAGHAAVTAVVSALRGASQTELQSKAIDAIAALVVYQPILQSAAVAAGVLKCLLPIALSSCQLRSRADDAIYCIVNCNFRNQQLLHAELQGCRGTHDLPPKLQRRAIDLDSVFCSGGLLQQLCDWCICAVDGAQQQRQHGDHSIAAAESILRDEEATSDDGGGVGIDDDSTPSVPQDLTQFGGTCYAFACVRSFNHRWHKRHLPASARAACDMFAACAKLVYSKVPVWLNSLKRSFG